MTDFEFKGSLIDPLYLYISSVIIMIGILLGCVCGCRKTKLDINNESQAGTITPIVDEGINANSSLLDAKQRVSSVKRSLPDIPKNTDLPWESGVAQTSDNCSDIYATVVGESPYEEAIGKTPTLNFINHRNSFPPISENNQSSPQMVASRSEILDQQQPVPPPRSRRSSSHSTPPASDAIIASQAISGQVSASQELPYITLPIPETRHPTENPNIEVINEINTTGNFSGDSQDSSKGYTSISVREPLANIQASTESSNRNDPPYDTLSNDSDDMYAAIDDTKKSTKCSINQENSRSQSGGNATYETVNSPYESVNSPKLEKRQANSPLPPPPAASTSTQVQQNVPINSPPRLEDIEKLYAVVIKKGTKKEKKDSNNLVAATTAAAATTIESRIVIDEDTESKSNDTIDPNYEEVFKSEPNYEVVKEAKYEYISSTTSDTDPNYECLADPPYEKLSKNTD